MRNVLNAILSVLRGGIASRLILKDLRPRSDAFAYLSRRRDAALFDRINHYRVIIDRERVGREAWSSTALLDSQTVKATESGGLRGYDARKKVKNPQGQPCPQVDVVEARGLNFRAIYRRMRTAAHRRSKQPGFPG